MAAMADAKRQTAKMGGLNWMEDLNLNFNKRMGSRMPSAGIVANLNSSFSAVK